MLYRIQRSRSQHDITSAKIRKIFNNSARDCSISLKFRTDFDHMTLDVPQTLKRVNGQGHSVSLRTSINKRYSPGTVKLSKAKLGEIYLRADRNTLHGVQAH